MAGKAKVSVSIGLEGESQYRQAITNINAAQKTLRSEMKATELQFRTNANSITALASKQAILSKQYEQQAKKVEVYETAVKECSEKEEKAAKSVEKLQKEYEAEQKSLESMKRIMPDATEQIALQEEKVQGLADKLSVAQRDYLSAQNATNKYQTSLNYANIELQQLDGELKKNQTYLDEASASTDGMAHSIDQFGEETEEASTQVTSMGKMITAAVASDVIFSALKTLVNGIKDVSSACIETGSQFEASMSKVEAVSGATGDELAALTDKAREMGATTMFSASEAAEAMNYMAMAGWKTEDMLSGIEGVMSLAAASGEDLATTSDIVTDALTAFGLSAQDAGHFADVLAAASSNANTNVAMMGETFSYCAPIAGSLGFSVEDTAEAIGLMANAGIKSSQAGTSLRRIMTELSKDVKIHGEALGDVVIKTTEADGSMRDLSEILADCRGAFNQLSESEKASAAASIAGKNAMSGFLALMNAAPADVEKLSSALDNCNGTAAAMAATMQDNLQGKLKILESALQAVEESAYGVFDDTLKNGVDSATEALTRLNASITDGDMGVALDHLNSAVASLMDDVIAGLEEHLPKITEGAADLIDNADNIASLIVTLVEAWGAYKIATDGAQTATALLNAELALNPYVAVTEAVILLGNAFVTVARNAAKAGEEQLKASKQTTESVKKTRELRETIKKSAEDFKTNAESIEATASASKTLADRLTELNAKWSDGQGREGFSEGIAQQKAIIGELNAAYPSLNLAIDENNGHLNMSTAALYANIEAMKKQAEAAAYQERLTEIAKEKLELDIQKAKLAPEITEAETKLAEAATAHKDAQEQLNEAQANGTAYFENTADVVAKATEAHLEAGHALAELKGENASCEEAISSLSEEEQIITEKMAAATQATQEQGEAASGAVEGVNTLRMSEEELENFIEGVNKAVEGQINLFEQYDEAAKVSGEELMKNLQSNVDALESWEGNYQELSSRVGTEGAALMANLAELGVKGNAEIKGLLDLNGDQLNEYITKYNQAMTLEESAASEILGSYMDIGTKAADSSIEGVTKEFDAEGGKVSDAAVEVVEDAEEEATESAQEFEKTGEETMTSTQKGIDENRDKVTKAIEDTGKAALKSAEDTMGKEKFVPIGEHITAGISEGIEKGTDGIVSQIQTLAEKAVAAANEKLKIQSPSKVFKEIGEYTMEGMAQGITAKSADVIAAVTRSMDETMAAGASAVTTPSGMDTNTLAGTIADALERGLNGFVMNINADVDKDAIVRITVDADRNGIKRTGSSIYGVV